MSWAGKRLVFAGRSELRDYMQARLRGEPPTLPAAPAERGVSPEDVLIGYFRHGELHEAQQVEFGSVWTEITTRAREERDAVVFRNAMALANGLPAPKNMEEIVAFLPMSAADYDWAEHDDHDAQGRILRLLLAWELVPEGAPFWRTVFHAYLEYIEQGGDTLAQIAQFPPLIAAYKGVGMLDRKDFRHLYSAPKQSQTSVMQQQVNAINTDQCFRYGTSDGGMDELVDLFEEAYVNVVISTSAPEPFISSIEPPCTGSMGSVGSAHRPRWPHPKDYPRMTGTSGASRAGAV